MKFAFRSPGHSIAEFRLNVCTYTSAAPRGHMDTSPGTRLLLPVSPRVPCLFSFLSPFSFRLNTESVADENAVGYLPFSKVRDDFMDEEGHELDAGGLDRVT